MSYKSLKFKITGESPLLLHNGQTADPLNPFAQAMKKITGKRTKTEDDYRELAKIEWMASLYLKDKKVCIPGMVFEACLADAARKSRRGKLALSGLFVPEDSPLVYDGPSNIEKLWEDEKFRLTCLVRVQKNRIVRTRAMFPAWSATIVVNYDPKVLNESDVREIVNTAGECGLCDWRPKFGRFSVE